MPTPTETSVNKRLKSQTGGSKEPPVYLLMLYKNSYFNFLKLRDDHSDFVDNQLGIQIILTPDNNPGLFVKRGTPD